MRLPRATPPPKDSLECALEEAAAWRDSTPEARFRAFADACRLAEVIVAARGESGSPADAPVPLPIASRALIDRLIRARRERGPSAE